MTYFLDLTGLRWFFNRLKEYFVAKETGKGLSSNDFSDEYEEIMNDYGDDIQNILCMDENGDFYVLEKTGD